MKPTRKQIIIVMFMTFLYFLWFFNTLLESLRHSNTHGLEEPLYSIKCENGTVETFNSSAIFACGEPIAWPVKKKNIYAENVDLNIS